MQNNKQRNWPIFILAYIHQGSWDGSKENLHIAEFQDCPKITLGQQVDFYLLHLIIFFSLFFYTELSRVDGFCSWTEIFNSCHKLDLCQNNWEGHTLNLLSYSQESFEIGFRLLSCWKRNCLPSLRWIAEDKFTKTTDWYIFMKPFPSKIHGWLILFGNTSTSVDYYM